MHEHIFGQRTSHSVIFFTMPSIPKTAALQNISARTVHARDTSDITVRSIMALILLLLVVLITSGICCCILCRKRRKLDRDRKLLMESATTQRIRFLGTRPAAPNPSAPVDLRPKYLIPDSQMVVCEDGTLMSLQPVLNSSGDSEMIDPEQAARTLRVLEFWNQSRSMEMRPSYSEIQHDDPPPYHGLRRVSDTREGLEVGIIR